VTGSVTFKYQGSSRALRLGALLSAFTLRPNQCCIGRTQLPQRLFVKRVEVWSRKVLTVAHRSRYWLATMSEASLSPRDVAQRMRSASPHAANNNYRAPAPEKRYSSPFTRKGFLAIGCSRSASVANLAGSQDFRHVTPVVGQNAFDQFRRTYVTRISWFAWERHYLDQATSKVASQHNDLMKYGKQT
jgi:hypothetical protein